MHPLRCCVLALAALAAVPAQSLRTLADQRGIFLGAAVDPSRFPETAYSATLAREFSQAEPENAMKFGPIHPARATYNFTAPDSIVDFARANGMAVRGHTLVWYNQNPAWLTNGNFAPSELSAILQDHIATVMGHYAGKVYAWDVVNEAFNDNGTMRSTLWYDTPGIGLSGTAYVEQAFRWARATDPQALLFYNDYNGEAVGTKSDAIYKMVADFKARGVPIDGVGLQMHFTNGTPNFAGIEANMQRLSNLGLQIHITELDVRLPVDSAGNATAANLTTQANIYAGVIASCLKFPLCTAIQTWGFTDKYSWVPGTFAGMGAALPFDTNYQPKAAYTSIQKGFQTAPPAIAAAGLVNAASYAGGAVAPGEIVVLFGANFGPASLQASGVNLLFDGEPAPVLYTKVRQTAAVVPLSVAGKATTSVTYEYQGIASAPVTVKVVPAIPGIVTLDASGHGPGAILDAAFHVISPDNPARPNDVILLYVAGAGIINAPATAKIGGIDCPVKFAGQAPGLIDGAVQMNVQLALGVPPGPQPVVVTFAGVESQPGVTVFIAR